MDLVLGRDFNNVAAPLDVVLHGMQMGFLHNLLAGRPQVAIRLRNVLHFSFFAEGFGRRRRVHVTHRRPVGLQEPPERELLRPRVIFRRSPGHLRLGRQDRPRRVPLRINLLPRFPDDVALRLDVALARGHFVAEERRVRHLLLDGPVGLVDVVGADAPSGLGLLLEVLLARDVLVVFRGLADDDGRGPFPDEPVLVDRFYLFFF